MVDRREMMKVLQNGAKTPTPLIQASEEVPEFGRFLFLAMLNKSRIATNVETGKHVVTELDTTTKVQCPSCDKVWSRTNSLMDTGHKGHCLLCGHLIEDWTKHQEV
jgi:predicted RNA-binding Zn-ribbon protein involved in translation (DUF1610 family)